MSLSLRFDSPFAGYTLSFEDDGRTGYAYLKENGRIVGDLWLYNRCQAPDTSEWADRGNAPFANCKGYVMEGSQLNKLVNRGDVLVTWKSDESGPIAYVYLFEDLYGVLGVGDKPGYARFAAKDGPIAKRMELENESRRAIEN
jgi:hypothetical protein